MDVIDLVAYERAVRLGEPVPTASTSQVLVHENAIVVAAIGARGERELPMSVAIGSLNQSRPVVAVAIPGLRAEPVAEGSPPTGSGAAPGGRDAIWPGVAPILANAASLDRHPQVVVANRVALKLLEAWAESARSARRGPGTTEADRVKDAAQALSYCCERAAVAGSHTAVVADEALSQHWAFPLATDAPLGARLASLRCAVPGAEPDPFLSLATENALFACIEEAARDAEKRKSVNGTLERLAIEAWSRVRAAANLLKEISVHRLPLPVLAEVCKAEDEAWLDHRQMVTGILRSDVAAPVRKLSLKLDGKAAPKREPARRYDMAKRDNERAAAMGFTERTEAGEAWQTALVAHDTFERSRAVLAGEALAGQVLSCDASTLVIESRQAILAVRAGDELVYVVPGDEEARATFVVTQVGRPVADGPYLAYLRCQDQALDVGSSVVLVPRLSDWPKRSLVGSRFKGLGWPHKPVKAPEDRRDLPRGAAIVPATPDEAERVVAEAVAGGHPLVVVASPPGAGKTTLLAKVVAAEVARGRRVLVAASTVAQCEDLAKRVAANGTPTWLLVHSGGYNGTRGAVTVCDDPKLLPDGPVAVVATVAKLGQLKGNGREVAHAELLAVDEAWQVTDVSFMAISGLAERYLLIGDPGQIPPVVTVDLDRWRAEPAGPHVPCPQALMARWGKAVELVRLPATRRFPLDTALALAPFYPGHRFGSVSESAPLSTWPFQARSLVAAEVSPAFRGAVDPAMERLTARLVRRVVEEGTSPTQVGVVCTYVRQVAGVRAALGSLSARVLVETANRWQGLQREVVIAWHPLTGAKQLSELGLDAGRLCVSVSRHQRGAILLMRTGVAELLEAGVASTGRVVVEGLKNHAGQWPYAPSGALGAQDPWRSSLSAQRSFLAGLEVEHWDEGT